MEHRRSRRACSTVSIRAPRPASRRDSRDRRSLRCTTRVLILPSPMSSEGTPNMRSSQLPPATGFVTRSRSTRPPRHAAAFAPGVPSLHIRSWQNSTARWQWLTFFVRRLAQALPKHENPNSDQIMNSPDPTPAVVAHELKRFRIACWIVVASGLFVVVMAFAFGDAPRPFIDRMNLFLARICGAAFCILAYSFWRFRHKAKRWPQQTNRRRTSRMQ